MNRLLENNEIRLRAPEPEDLDLLYQWENDTRLWSLGASNVPFSRYSLHQYLANNQQDIYTDKQLRLMVELKHTGETVGTVDLYDFDPLHLRAGVGILIDPNHQQKGLGLQALQLLEAYAFTFLTIHQLYAVIPESNHASIHLFRKAQYIEAGTLSDWISREGTFQHARLYQRINK